MQYKPESSRSTRTGGPSAALLPATACVEAEAECAEVERRARRPAVSGGGEKRTAEIAAGSEAADSAAEAEAAVEGGAGEEVEVELNATLR
jgi:hypothetical protein